ncbi:MAG: hypothetical protein GXP53_03230 [Deltaproteobacteria bacterium]|nr:hypothetical protein [Deltaproteobacteria bacterium]
MITEKDLILIYDEEQPALFARIEDISPDVKKGWYQVRLLLLNLPLTTVTWILRDAYINGGQFTMNGNRMRFEKVESPKPETAPELLPEEPPAEKRKPNGKEKHGPKVIDFASLKKPKS